MLIISNVKYIYIILTQNVYFFFVLFTLIKKCTFIQNCRPTFLKCIRLMRINNFFFTKCGASETITSYFSFSRGLILLLNRFYILYFVFFTSISFF